MLIHRLRAAERLDCTILSPSVWGVWTHWNGVKSEGCYGEQKNDCDGCKRGLPRRWKGYLHVVSHATRTEFFLELTPLVDDMIKHHAPTGQALRGMMFRFERLKGDKARVRVTYSGCDHSGNALPKHEDPERVLRTLWGEFQVVTDDQDDAFPDHLETA